MQVPHTVTRNPASRSDSVALYITHRQHTTYHTMQPANSKESQVAVRGKESATQLTIKSRTRPKTLPKPPPHPTPAKSPTTDPPAHDANKNQIPCSHKPITPRIAPNHEMPTRVQPVSRFEKPRKYFEVRVLPYERHYVRGLGVVGELERYTPFESPRAVVQPVTRSNPWFVACGTEV